MKTHSESIFLLGAGFTKAAFPQAPLNNELLEEISKDNGKTLSKYKNKYDTNDIEKLLTQLDLEATENDEIKKDRLVINAEISFVSYLFLYLDRVSSWGPPQGSFKLSDGSLVIEYIRSRNAQIGGHTYTAPQTTYHSGTAYGSRGSAYGTYSGTSTTYVQKQTPTYNINLMCKTRFTVNPQGIITRWSWQGNSCTALPPK